MDYAFVTLAQGLFEWKAAAKVLGPVRVCQIGGC